MHNNMIIIIGIIITIYLLKMCVKFRNKVYKLFILAESTLVSGEKMNYVVNQIYDYLPKTMKIIINKTMLRFIIQRMFNVVKDFLNDGKFNNNGDSNERTK